MSRQRASPRLKARIAGALYLAVFASAFAEVVRSGLIVSGDAAATAANIIASETLFRVAFAADLVGTASYVGVTLLLFDLLRPVSRTMSLLAAFYGLVGAAVMAGNLLNHLAPLALLDNELSAFTSAQLQSLARTSLRLHGQGYLISLVFFGVHLLLLGVLILRSSFLPRVLGALLVIAGSCYLINSFVAFLAPDVALAPYILLPGLVAEGGLTLWLLVMGVDAEKWRDQVVAAGADLGGEAT